MCSEDLRTKERSQMEAEVHRRELTKGGSGVVPHVGSRFWTLVRGGLVVAVFLDFSYEVLRGRWIQVYEHTFFPKRIGNHQFWAENFCVGGVRFALR